MALYPQNRTELVDSILKSLKNNIDPNKYVKIEYLNEKPYAAGKLKK